MIFYVFCVILAIIIVAVVICNVKIDVTTLEIPCDRELKILHLSDLHKKKFGKNYNRLLKKIPKIDYDCIFFTGDLISRSEESYDEKVNLLKTLCKIAPVYYIGGNHEADVPQIYESLCRELKNVGVTVLRNESVNFCVHGKTGDLAGLEPEGRFYKNSDGSYKNLPQMSEKYLAEKLGKKGENFTILLAHSPFAFDEYQKWGADLVFSGHVHGGVVRVPILGGILSPERKFFPKFSEGIYTKKGTKMVVSRGLGKFRLFNNSQIIVVKLKEQ